MALQSIEQAWAEFAEFVFGGMTPIAVQYKEMHNAFFAGATEVVMQLFEIRQRLNAIGDEAMSKDEAKDHMQALENECRAFGKAMMQKCAERN